RSAPTPMMPSSGKPLRRPLGRARRGWRVWEAIAYLRHATRHMCEVGNGQGHKLLSLGIIGKDVPLPLVFSADLSAVLICVTLAACNYPWRPAGASRLDRSQRRWLSSRQSAFSTKDGADVSPWGVL